MCKRTNLCLILNWIGLIALGSCLAFGQGATAAISGIVRDSTGAVVPGATITAKHLESGLTRSATSSENGGYNVQLLPVGAYEHPRASEHAVPGRSV